MHARAHALPDPWSSESAFAAANALQRSCRLVFIRGLNVRVCWRGTRATHVRFSNRTLNKSRGNEVERLVTFLNDYEKNSLCIKHACSCCVCSAARGKSGRIGRFLLQ